jgi:ribosomal protein S18 acetylase RimI-like enzyme
MTALRPMTESEFARYTGTMWEDYAQERARNSGRPIEEERAEAARQRVQLQKDGMRTEGHRYWTVTDDSGAPVGVLWVAVDAPKKQAFIYDIRIDEQQRGKGHGKATLDLLEAELRPLGVARIALNVFADNTVAQSLYRRQGYYPVATLMQKDL